MALTLETHLVAAYIVSRRVTFAGAPVTLAKLAQMWKLPIEPGQPFLNVDVLTHVAKYLRMTVPDLLAAVRKMPLPEPSPATAPAPAPVLEVTTFKIAERPVTVTSQASPVVAPIPEPTQVIPRAQLDELRAASRSEPSAPKRESEPEILISFDEIDPATTEAETESSPTEPDETATTDEAATTAEAAPAVSSSTASPRKRSRGKKKQR